MRAFHPETAASLRSTDDGTDGARTGSVSLSCQVFRDFSGLDYLRAEWDEAVLQAGGSIYMTYDWVRVWWKFYGSSAELRLFVFSAADRVVAVVPLYIDTLGWGPFRIRVARLVGANVPPKVFDPPVPEDCAAAVFAEVLSQLFVRDTCDLLSLGPVSDLVGWTHHLVRVCRQRTDLVRHCAVAAGVHSVFHLPGDMEEYYAALSKNERKNRRKYDLRLMKKEYDTRVEVVKDRALVSDEFERFAKQHSVQWCAEGKTGHFGAWPNALDFNRSLVAAQGSLGRLRFIRIVADGQVVASQYIFAFGDRYYWELPARAVESKWDRFSLGPTAIVTMLAQGLSEGVRRVEGGLAHYDYKVRLGAKEYTALTFRIVPSNLSSRVRFVLFSAVTACVRVAYHKLWYRRLMPRLPPVLWRPQWRLWLRLDF
jgi:CelD/BcsL family acetyltransferase involved in cellulose biosynthesis